MILKLPVELYVCLIYFKFNFKDAGICNSYQRKNFLLSTERGGLAERNRFYRRKFKILMKPIRNLTPVRILNEFLRSEQTG